jgi:hypothetical protein
MVSVGVTARALLVDGGVVPPVEVSVGAVGESPHAVATPAAAADPRTANAVRRVIRFFCMLASFFVVRSIVDILPSKRWKTVSAT